MARWLCKQGLRAMNRLLMVFILSLLSVPLAAAGKQTDKDRANLTGPVQTISTVSFTERPDGWRDRQRVNTTYDSKGNEVETAFYNSSDAGGALYEKAVHVYDNQGKRTETLYRDGSSLHRKTVYTYNAQGLLTERITCDAAGCFDKIAYTYDPQGNLTEEVFYDPDGSSIKLHLVHTYDAQGHRTETTSYDTHDPALGIEKVVTTYDTKGNILETISYYTEKVGDERGKPIPLPSKFVYTYEFDTYGNWIKQTQTLCTSETGKPVCEPSMVTYRTITYYPETERSQP